MKPNRANINKEEKMEANVNSDDFCDFLRWRVREEFDDAEDIIKIIEQPHHYVSDYITFLKEEVYGETQ